LRRNFSKNKEQSSPDYSISINIIMGESTKAADAVDKLVRAVGGKFTGLKYDIWKSLDTHHSFKQPGGCDHLGRACDETSLTR